MKIRGKRKCKHNFIRVLHSVAESTDKKRAVIVFREKCSKCPAVKRQWGQRVTGISTNGQGWTLEMYLELVKELLNIEI